MSPFFVILMVILVSLAVCVTRLAQASRGQRQNGESVEELRARIRALETIITDQDRRLRGDFDGLA
ncbi:MAG: hypothetical protein AAF216_09415 [Pseudomonadota bacterium]